MKYISLMTVLLFVIDSKGDKKKLNVFQDKSLFKNEFQLRNTECTFEFI